MTRDEFIDILTKSADEALTTVKQSGKDNPIEAWTLCEGILDAAVRREIGKKLKENGRNPYTGAVIRSTAPAAAQNQGKDI